MKWRAFWNYSKNEEVEAASETESDEHKKKKKKTKKKIIVKEILWLFHFSYFHSVSFVGFWIFNNEEQKIENVFVSEFVHVLLKSTISVTASHNVRTFVCVRVLRFRISFHSRHYTIFLSSICCCWCFFFLLFLHFICVPVHFMFRKSRFSTKCSIVLLRLKWNSFIVATLVLAQMNETMVGPTSHTLHQIEATIITLMTKDDDFLAKWCT